MAKSKKAPMPPKPKVLPPADQKEQSERFLAAVQKLVDAGELNPTEAEVAFELATSRLLDSGRPARQAAEGAPDAIRQQKGCS